MAAYTGKHLEHRVARDEDNPRLLGRIVLAGTYPQHDLWRWKDGAYSYVGRYPNSIDAWDALMFLVDPADYRRWSRRTAPPPPLKNAVA